MGSPMVFQTAPPQPASKARVICSPQLVGGAEASQKGFGERIPAKFTARFGASGMGNLERPRNRRARSFAIGDRVDDFASAIDAIAAGKIFGIRGNAGGTIHDHAAVTQLEAAA